MNTKKPNKLKSDALELDVVLKMILDEAINTSGIGVSGILRMVAQGSRDRYAVYRSTLATALGPIAQAHDMELAKLLLIADNVDANELTDATKIEDIADQIDARPELSPQELLAKIASADALPH